MRKMKIQTLQEQPFDSFLLAKSALYKKSRAHYLKQGGRYRVALLSSARSLGSASLIKNEIEYTPIGSELEWTRSDHIQKKDRKYFEQLRGFVTNVFHEQNHRILWAFLKRQGVACPQTREHAYRFLNLIESLVVILDMALGDELNAKTSAWLNDARITYSPGSVYMRKLKKKPRLYRNALQVILHTSYLRLEGLHPEDIPVHVRNTFPTFDSTLVEMAIDRAVMIDPMFVELTNPIWQKKHVRKVMTAFASNSKTKPLLLPKRRPLHNIEAYSLAEKWMDFFSI